MSAKRLMPGWCDALGEARSTVEASPLWATLPVVQRDAVVDLDDDRFFALRQPTALSVPWLLDYVVADLAAAADRT